jgi:hypothetical protein
MPEKDSRTDNWAGHKPTKWNYNDPNMHFPRSTKEIGWGDYQPNFKGLKEKSDEHINWWIVGFFVVLFLLLHNIGVF